VPKKSVHRNIDHDKNYSPPTVLIQPGRPHHRTREHPNIRRLIHLMLFGINTQRVSLLFFFAFFFSAAFNDIESIIEENIAQTKVFEQKERMRRFSIGGFFFLSVRFDSSKDSLHCTRLQHSANGQQPSSRVQT
jgi:hypothetical protein